MSKEYYASRDWRLYIQDMIEFCEKVLSYSEGMDQDVFLADAMTYDATLRNLELLGEAATHIPDAIRKAHPEVPWRKIVGSRNRLAHAYLHVDQQIVWTGISEAVPKLLPVLRELLEADKKDKAG